MQTETRSAPPRPNLRGEVPSWKLAIERFNQMRRLYRDWPVALMDRLRVRPSSSLHVYDVRAEGRQFRLLARRNGFDVRAINELWIARVYDRWVSLLPDPSIRTVVDVGANCGYFTVLAAGLLGADRVIAIEPDPHNAAILRANAALNSVNAIVVEAAVVESEGIDTIALNRSDDPRLHSVLSDADVRIAGLADRGRRVGEVSVRATTLAQVIGDWVGDGVDFLKVDIEGLEWAVIESLPDEVLRTVRCLVVESDVAAPAELLSRLARLAFAVHVDAVFTAAIRTR